MTKTITVTFEDTVDTWETVEFLTVGLEREYTRIAVQSRDAIAAGDDKAFNDLTLAVDKVILKSTVAWSYGPITIETLHDIVPSHHFAQIIDALSVRFIPLVLRNIEASANAYSSLLNQEDLFRTNSISPLSPTSPDGPSTK